MPTDPVKRLELARAAFQNGQYDRLSLLLLPTLEPVATLEDRAQRAEARSLLGLGLFFEAQAVAGVGKRKKLLAQTRAHFLELLREDPDHKLDVRIFPASIIELFESVRAANADELERIRIERSGQVTEPGKTQTIFVERAVQRRQYWVSFLPMGAGQFQNGHKLKGALFAGGQGAALALNAFGLIGNLIGVRDNPAGYPDADTLARALRRRNIQIGAAIAFWALYAGSVADAVYFYEGEELLHLRTLDRPPPELDRDRQPTPTSPTSGAWMMHWSWSF